MTHDNVLSGMDASVVVKQGLWDLVLNDASRAIIQSVRKRLKGSFENS